MCRQGASAIQSEVLEQIDDSSLRAYIAWVPILPDDKHSEAVESMTRIPDARAAHFWDEQRALPELLNPVLSLPEGWPAWDVYLAYPPGATWAQAPPAPAFWHHQLGDEPKAPKLDAPAFAEQLRSLLADQSRDGR